MKIAILASGSRGDVQPYVALGKGLHGKGYDICVITSDDFQGLVESAGLAFYSLGHSVEALIQSDEWRALIESGNFLKIVAGMQREMKTHAHELARKLPAALENVDLLITGMGGMGGGFAIADQLGIPVIQAYVLPFTPTQEFPSPLTPSLPFGKTFNRLSFHMTRQMIWQTTRISDEVIRRELGMAKGSFWGAFKALEQQKVPAIYGYSQHVIPRPSDWASHHHVTGYWFLDAPSDWTPPSDLVAFLEKGSAPVYIGFGSMSNRNPTEAGQIALEALAVSGQRGVIASGWGGLHATDLPDNVIMISSVPHSWLFPKMAAVVHHGGAGTTAAGFAAGVPSIIVPFMGDQPFWGVRAAELGVGTAPIPRKKLNSQRLGEAIKEAMSNQSMRQRAKTLGEHIQAEDGIGNAVAIIEQLSASLVR